MNMLSSDIQRKEIAAGRHIAAKYDEAYETLFYERIRKHIAQQIVAKEAHPIRILDLGCGTGNLTKYLCSPGSASDCYGIDISPDMLAIAKAKLSGAHFVVGIAERLPFERQSFDAVAGFSVLHHLPDLTHTFTEICRVLKPGGSFLFGEPAQSTLEERPMIRRAFELPLYPLYRIVRKKNQAALRVVETIDFHKFETRVHRHLSEAEVLEALETCSSTYHMQFELQRFDILASWIGNHLLSTKIDHMIFSVLWRLDRFLSSALPPCCHEMLIAGTIHPETSTSHRPRVTSPKKKTD